MNTAKPCTTSTTLLGAPLCKRKRATNWRRQGSARFISFKKSNYGLVEFLPHFGHNRRDVDVLWAMASAAATIEALR